MSPDAARVYERDESPQQVLRAEMVTHSTPGEDRLTPWQRVELQRLAVEEYILRLDRGQWRDPVTGIIHARRTRALRVLTVAR